MDFIWAVYFISTENHVKEELCQQLAWGSCELLQVSHMQLETTDCITPEQSMIGITSTHLRILGVQRILCCCMKEIKSLTRKFEQNVPSCIT